MPVPLVAALPALGGVFGGILGAGSASADRAAAAAANRRAIQYLESVGIPSIEAQQIALENPEFVGQFTPEGEQAFELGSSRMEEISVDPRLKDAQMAALTSLQEQGQTPLNASERAQLNQQRRAGAQEAQARQNLILQNMQERGAGGSGMELAARLQASQASAQRQGEESDRLAAMAQERALAAIAQGGALGGQIRGQEFGEQERVASAADAIAQFNLANRQNVQMRNVGTRNVAGQREADIRQQLEGQRAATANQQQVYNKQLLQQRYENEMAKARNLAAAAQGQVGYHQKEAASKAQAGTNIGAGLGQVGGIAAAGLTRNDSNMLDTDLEDPLSKKDLTRGGFIAGSAPKRG